MGRIKKLIPLRDMAKNFGLVNESKRPKLRRMSFFTPEGKVALMFLKMPRRPLDLLGKILKEIQEEERAYEKAESLLMGREKGDLEINTKISANRRVTSRAETAGKASRIG